MVLATIIRLEMAYPGVGILAGDSLQYLSVVTAHAVIMVFFMIMPLLFGAFGNFLLPTQLGVHDVAFPRLNSVAFWFLPGGLLMLCQLLCLDRRYQRMNCFNMREIQTLLKARFYTDLLNENHQHLFLSRTSPNVRFKLQDLNFLSSCELLLNRYGVLKTSNPRFQEYNVLNKITGQSQYSEGNTLLNLEAVSSSSTSNSYFNIFNKLSQSNYNSKVAEWSVLIYSAPDKILTITTTVFKKIYSFSQVVSKSFMNLTTDNKGSYTSEGVSVISGAIINTKVLLNYPLNLLFNSTGVES